MGFLVLVHGWNAAARIRTNPIHPRSPIVFLFDFLIQRAQRFFLKHTRVAGVWGPRAGGILFGVHALEGKKTHSKTRFDFVISDFSSKLDIMQLWHSIFTL